MIMKEQCYLCICDAPYEFCCKLECNQYCVFFCEKCITSCKKVSIPCKNKTIINKYFFNPLVTMEDKS